MSDWIADVLDDVRGIYGGLWPLWLLAAMIVMAAVS